MALNLWEIHFSRDLRTCSSTLFLHPSSSPPWGPAHNLQRSRPGLSSLLPLLSSHQACPKTPYYCTPFSLARSWISEINIRIYCTKTWRPSMWLCEQYSLRSSSLLSSTRSPLRRSLSFVLFLFLFFFFFSPNFLIFYDGIKSQIRRMFVTLVKRIWRTFTI